MLTLITVLGAAAFLMAASAAIDPRKPACERMAQADGLRRGYDTGHRPAPPAQTHFS